MTTTEKTQTTFSLADIASIKVNRNVWYDIRFRNSYGQDDLTWAYGEKQKRETLAKLKPRNILKVKRNEVLEVHIVTTDGRESPEFPIYAEQISDLLAGKILSVNGYDRQMNYMYGSLTFIELTQWNNTFKKFEYALPREVLLTALRRARHEPLPEENRNTRTTYRIGDRHRTFWTPTAVIDWTPEALERYEAHQDWPAYTEGSRTLKDLIAERLQHATNYSRNTNEVYTLRVMTDSHNPSLYWGIVAPKTGKWVYNGGIIWHQEYGQDDPTKGHYAVHT